MFKHNNKILIFPPTEFLFYTYKIMSRKKYDEDDDDQITIKTNNYQKSLMLTYQDKTVKKETKRTQLNCKYKRIYIYDISKKLLKLQGRGRRQTKPSQNLKKMTITKESIISLNMEEKFEKLLIET